MTKRILVSVLLLVIALSLAVTSYCLLQSKIARLEQALENAVYTDLPAQESSEEIRENAQESLRWMRVLLLHEELTALTTELDNLEADANDEQVFRQTCRRCLSLLSDIKDGQRISAENIL